MILLCIAFFCFLEAKKSVLRALRTSLFSSIPLLFFSSLLLFLYKRHAFSKYSPIALSAEKYDSSAMLCFMRLSHLVRSRL